MFEVISLPNHHLCKELYSQQIAWTSLDPYLYSSEPYSASSAVVEGSNCKLNWDIVTDIMSTTPLEPEWFAVHSTPSELLCNPGQCPVDGLTGLIGLTQLENNEHSPL